MNEIETELLHFFGRRGAGQVTVESSRGGQVHVDGVQFAQALYEAGATVAEDGTFNRETLQQTAERCRQLGFVFLADVLAGVGNGGGKLFRVDTRDLSKYQFATPITVDRSNPTVTLPTPIQPQAAAKSVTATPPETLPASPTADRLVSFVNEWGAVVGSVREDELRAAFAGAPLEVPTFSASRLCGVSFATLARQAEAQQHSQSAKVLKTAGTILGQRFAWMVSGGKPWTPPKWVKP